MIIQGRNGCLCLFWNDRLVSGFPIGSNTLDNYMKTGEKIILDGMSKGKKIPELLYTFRGFCECLYQKRVIHKKKITEHDHQVFLHCIMALIKLQILDFDDVCFVAPRKKGKRGKRFIQRIAI
jgi:hypothetical protein